MSLLEIERQKYERVWDLPEYRMANHGLKMWREQRDLYPSWPKTAIDIGCGNGRLVSQWRNEAVDAWGIDFAHNAPDASNREHVVLGCLWEEWPLVPSLIGEKFDMGNCTDVMEHIPPEKVDDVLANIAEACKVTVFKIANYVSHFGDGKLHLTLQDDDWWWMTLSKYGSAEFIAVPGIGSNEYIFRLTSP